MIRVSCRSHTNLNVKFYFRSFFLFYLGEPNLKVHINKVLADISRNTGIHFVSSGKWSEYPGFNGFFGIICEQPLICLKHFDAKPQYHHTLTLVLCWFKPDITLTAWIPTEWDLHTWHKMIRTWFCRHMIEHLVPVVADIIFISSTEHCQVSHRMPLYFIPVSVRVRLARTLLKRLLS